MILVILILHHDSSEEVSMATKASSSNLQKMEVEEEELPRTRKSNSSFVVYTWLKEGNYKEFIHICLI